MPNGTLSRTAWANLITIDKQIQMRTFLLVLALAFFGSFTIASAQNCGELEMSQLNFNAITYTAAFNASFEAYEAVTSPAAIYVDIQLDNHDPNVPPTMMPTFGWSLQTNNYLSQGRIRLRGLVLPGSTSVTSPVIEFDVLEGAGCALFKVDGAKFHRYRMNPCNVQVFGAYDEDCEEREDIEDIEETVTQVATLEKHLVNGSNGTSFIPCGNGVNSATFGVPLGQTRTYTYRIKAIGEEEAESLIITGISMEVGEFYTLNTPGVFPLEIPVGGSYDFTVTFHSECFGYYSDYFIIQSNDLENPVCSNQVRHRTEPLPGPQLSVLVTHATEEYSFAGGEETNVLPSNYQDKIPAVGAGEERLIVLDITNNGLEELDINDVIWTGPVDPRNDHPFDALNIGGVLDAGHQAFFWAYLTDEADCDNDEITVTFLTNNGYHACNESLNSSSFTIQVVFNDEECPENVETDHERWKRKRFAEDEVSVKKTTVFPTITSDFLYLRGVPESGGNYQIFNLSGMAVNGTTGLLKGAGSRIDVSHLPAGAYLLRLEESREVLRFYRR